MSKLDIYCLTSKEFEFFKRLPSNIIPLGLGKNKFSKNIINENSGESIVELNRYFAEMTGIYWIYKNKINNYNENDFVGFCHYRRLWLREKFEKKHNNKEKLFDVLLSKQNDYFKGSDVILLNPTYLKNETIYEHFKNNHGEDIIKESFKLLNDKQSIAFKHYLNNRSFSLCNMFITKPKVFIKYCEFIFPLLFNLLEFSKSNNLLTGRNIKLPAYFMERFTSFWFHNYYDVKYLSYIQLNNFLISDLLNKNFNTFKIPFSHKFYPTVLDI